MSTFSLLKQLKCPGNGTRILAREWYKNNALQKNITTGNTKQLVKSNFTISATTKQNVPGKKTSIIKKIFLSTIGFTTASILYVKISANHYSQKVSKEEHKLPKVYDPFEIKSFWNKYPTIAIDRMFTIMSTITPFLVKLIISTYVTNLLSIDDGKNNNNEKETRQKERAVEFRQLLQQLGPCFIKFGQMLSIRPDVLPPVVVYELQKLCDSVPAYPTPKALEVLKKELNVKNASDVYLDLDEDTKPIAAASLGQVYKCRLRSNPNKYVAVKIQRPDMIRTVSLDLYLLRKYSETVEKMKSMIYSIGLAAKRKSYDIQLLDTFANASYFELDYVHEGKNQERIAKELIPRIGKDKMYIPKVYWDHTSRKVLTSEFIDGVQLAKSDSKVIKRLIPVGVKVYLAQLLDTGFFHSDPHPGNLLVDTKGRLVLIDFGLCATVAKPDTENMTKAIVHLMSGDMGKLLDDAIELGFLPRDVDKLNLVPVLEQIYSSAQLEINEEEKKIFSQKKVFRSAQRRKRFQSISKELNMIFFEYPFTVPEYFALITRALIVLEGIALSGDSQFDIFHASYPYAKDRAVEIFGVSNVLKILSNAV